LGEGSVEEVKSMTLKNKVILVTSSGKGDRKSEGRVKIEVSSDTISQI
jgi:hypothetical protein